MALLAVTCVPYIYIYVCVCARACVGVCVYVRGIFSSLYVFHIFCLASLIEFGNIIIITPLDFFTSVLVDGFSLEFERQQVSSSHQDSSQYSGRSQQCCRLDSLYLSAKFQVFQAL